MTVSTVTGIATVLVGATVLCSCQNPSSQSNAADNSHIRAVLPSANEVLIDGSSTVGPLTIALAETFQATDPSIQVPVGTSGSGGGFAKFCVGETDISNASRPITPSEIATCAANNIDFVELPIAFDGVAFVTNKDNTFVQCLTLEQLNFIWNASSEGNVRRWSDFNPIFDTNFDNISLALFAPGTASGTFDYFNEVVLHQDDIRADFTPSEDDNVIVNGVAGSPGGLGFFGLSYYEANTDILNIVAIDSGKGCVIPSHDTVVNDTYAPLARPLFIYVSTAAANRPEVASFVNFYLDRVGELATNVGYIPLQSEVYSSVATHWQSRNTGSNFQDIPPGTPLGTLFE